MLASTPLDSCYTPKDSMRILLSALLMVFFFCFDSARAQAYSDYHWHDVESPDLSLPPVLARGDTLDLFQGALYFDRQVIWILNNTNHFEFLIWNIETKASRHIPFGPERIRGMAWNASTHEVVIRTRHELLFLDPVSFTTKRRIPFEKLDFYWRDMTIMADRLLAVASDESHVDEFDIANGTKLQTLPFLRKNIQRIFPWKDGQVWLWSSFWGSELLALDIRTGRMGKTVSAMIPHRALFKGAAMEDGRVGTFDIQNNVFSVLQYFNHVFFNLCDGAQECEHGYRYSPVRKTFIASVILSPQKDMPTSEILLLVPASTTFGQETAYESFSKNAKVFFDAAGNRYIKLQLPEIEKGKTYRETYYTGTVTCYSVSFDVSTRQQNYSVPDSLRIYLQDGPDYKLNDEVTQSYFQKLTAEATTPAEKIHAIFRFVADSIRHVWDGRNDPAPQVLLQRHGGCSEHSYVQIALLRKCGIPARFNWNFLPGDNRKIELDHKCAEVWIPNIGWLPLEGMDTSGHEGNYRWYALIFAAVDREIHGRVTDELRWNSFSGPKGFSLMDLCKPVMEWKLEELLTRSYSGPDSTIEKLPKNKFFDLNSQKVLE